MKSIWIQTAQIRFAFASLLICGQTRNPDRSKIIGSNQGKMSKSLNSARM